MLMEERFAAILKILAEKPAVTVAELTELLDSSESTVRRDLAALHNMGKLHKVHGGATAIDADYSAKDDDVASRQELHADEKMRIGRFAASLIEKDDFVYIDAGTTTEAMLAFITEKRAVFVTNGTVHAKKLVQHGCRAFVLGGEIKLATEAVVGAEALGSLRKYNFTKGFFGTNGIHMDMGYSTPDVTEALVKQEAMRKCRECFVLADAAKFGRVSPVTFGQLADASVITTRLEDESIQGYTNILEVDRT